MNKLLNPSSVHPEYLRSKFFLHKFDSITYNE
jgi:hypothetical protein